MSWPKYDVAVRPWLPVRISDSTTSVGLRELFLRAHELTDVEFGLPPAASGLWRLLTVMAARITGLDRQDEEADSWYGCREEVWTQGELDAEAVEAYFDRYADRFDLFDAARPWLQDPRLGDECPKSSGLNKLVMFRPSGNNQVWLDHHHDGENDPISAAEAIGHLITQLYYGPSGRCTSRTVDGRSEANTTAGPLRSVISFHPVGRSVFESLVAGIPYVGEGDGADAAPWETEELPNPLGMPPAPAGVGGVLAGRFRHAVLLTPGDDDESVVDARITWAWREPHPIVEDPYLVYQVNKQGDPYARPASADRALWRDLDSLLLKDVGLEHRRRPRVLDDPYAWPAELRDVLRVCAYGFDQDGQTRNRQWFTAATPRVLELLTDPARAAGVSRTREVAERAERYLRDALRTAWTAINDPSNGNGRSARNDIPAGPWPTAAATRYWPRAEERFWRRVHARDFDDPAKEFVALALDVYDAVTEQAGSRPRTKRAIERARGYIFATYGRRPRKENR